MITGKPSRKRKHAAHQRLPGNRTNDSVYRYGRNVERKGLLKTTHRRVCRWSKDPVDLGPLLGSPDRWRKWNSSCTALTASPWLPFLTCTTRVVHVMGPTIPLGV